MRQLRWLLICLLGCHGALALDVTAAPCGASGLSAGQHSVTVVSAGRSRSVLVFVPAAAHGRELPLVFDLHGSGGNGESQAHSSRLADVAAPGEILVSSLSAMMVARTEEFHFVDDRETTLKGLSRPERVATLVWAG